MVRVYVDEDVSAVLGMLLRARNVDAATARDVGMLGKRDDEHFSKAIELRRVLITHNRVDFENLYTQALKENKSHDGVIILSRKRDVYSSAQRLIRFFALHPVIENELWYL